MKTSNFLIIQYFIVAISSCIFWVGYCSGILKHAITGQDDLQGRASLGSSISVTPPPGISNKLDRSPSVTPPEAWGGEASERSGLRQPTMSRFEYSAFSWYRT